jgi:cytochrome b561
MPQSGRYTRMAILFHWVVAVLIISNLTLIQFTESFGENNVRFMYDTHKSIGVTVLGLVILRLLWRLTHTPPAHLVGQKAWEKIASKWAHAFLYFLMFFMPLTGWVHDSAWDAAPEIKMYWFDLFEVPRIEWVMALEPPVKEIWHGILGQAHEIGGYALYGLIFLHVAGALKHQFYDKQRELQRIW